MATRWSDAAWFSQALALYAPVIYGVGLFLAWRFGRSRVSAVLVGLILLTYLPEAGSEFGGASVGSVGSPVGSAEASTGSPWEASGLILLVLIGLLSPLRDRGVLSKLGVMQPLAAAVGVSVGWALMWSGRSGALEWAWVPIMPGGLAPWSGLSDATVFAGIASLALTVGMGIRRDHPVEKGLFWALLAILVAIASGANSDTSMLYLLVAGMILAIAVVETSYVMAFRDELTGLPGRRALWRELDEAGRFFAVGMLDIDHFKNVNDRHGHDVGDQVLRLVASRLGRITGGGRAFRYGGEEFAIVFPASGRDDAYDHLEALRKTIEEGDFTVRGRGRGRRHSKPPKAKKKQQVELSLTVSIGVAERTDKNPTTEAVVKAADEALYRAKQRGRNRVAR